MAATLSFIRPTEAEWNALAALGFPMAQATPVQRVRSRCRPFNELIDDLPDLDAPDGTAWHFLILPAGQDAWLTTLTDSLGDAGLGPVFEAGDEVAADLMALHDLIGRVIETDRNAYAGILDRGQMAALTATLDDLETAARDGRGNLKRMDRLGGWRPAWDLADDDFWDFLFLDADDQAALLAAVGQARAVLQRCHRPPGDGSAADQAAAQFDRLQSEMEGLTARLRPRLVRRSAAR